jgi:hypothetical protein
MTFDQIERVIRAKLPPSATNSRAWWSNNPSNSVMTKAWRDAGFRSEHVDIEGRRVTFRRVRSEPPRNSGAPAVGATTEGRHPIIGWMKGTLTIPEGVDLTQPADPEWADRK